MRPRSLPVALLGVVWAAVGVVQGASLVGGDTGRAGAKTHGTASSVLRRSAIGVNLQALSKARRANLRAGSRQPVLMTDLMAHGDIVGGYLQPQRQQQILAIQPRSVSPQQEAGDFQYFDENGDGEINKNELSDFLYELHPSKKDFNRIYSALDLDDNGFISWAEFNTPLDIELFDFLDRTHNGVTAREIEYVEELYTKEFGNPMAAMRTEKASEFNMAGEEIVKPSADEKYLAGYGWFKGESPVIDAMYPNIQSNPAADDDNNNPGKQYSYSYG